ncbi:hypothetical protein [Acidithiobacillus caldus]|nr:hypothetical protein [Acidithiobacillus caldus]
MKKAILLDKRAGFTKFKAFDPWLNYPFIANGEKDDAKLLLQHAKSITS